MGELLVYRRVNPLSKYYHWDPSSDQLLDFLMILVESDSTRLDTFGNGLVWLVFWELG